MCLQVHVCLNITQNTFNYVKTKGIQVQRFTIANSIDCYAVS